jgi:hypothetical protein
MDVLKCVFEGVPFHCHEREAVCSGWAILWLTRVDQDIEVPWDFSGQAALSGR